jgi:hypothetical protein
LCRFIAGAAAATIALPLAAQEDGPRRSSIVARAHVWSATDVPRMSVRVGPTGSGAFKPGETLACDYLDEELSGASPKFACRAGKEDELKVKYGGTNGEVYGEVAASRLLWALGFGADRMYPVKVVCRGCPRELGGIERLDGYQLFDPASVERKAPGEELEPGGNEGWSWSELDRIDPRVGGSPKAHRDALKLLAVFLQHSDSKPQQQRIVCLTKPDEEGGCSRPFMLINDLGLTFGRASWTNVNQISAANLLAWSRTPVWKAGADGCVGNLPRSFSGTLNDPSISEEGRRFLASLLSQLSDTQIHDLFDVARFDLRPRDPSIGRSGFPAIQEWVDAFKDKRRQIVEKRC